MNILLDFYYCFSLASIVLRRFFFKCTKEDIKEDQEDMIDILAICCFSYLLEIIISKYKKNLNINYEILFIIMFAYYIYYSCCKDIWSKNISNNFLLNKKLEIDYIDAKCEIKINNYLYQIDHDILYNILNTNEKSRGVYKNDKNIQIIKIELTNYYEENPFDLNKLYIADEIINSHLKKYRSKYDILFNTSFEIEYEFHLTGFFKNYHALKDNFKSFSSLFLIDSNINNEDLIYLIDDDEKYLRKIKIENSFQLSSDLIFQNKYIFDNINQVDIINCSLCKEDKINYITYNNSICNNSTYNNSTCNNRYWNLSLVNVNI